MNLDSISLPDDLEWVDEFSWTPVAQAMSYSATGALFVQESLKQAGRPITLQSEQDTCWVPRQTILDLQELRDQANKEMTLTLSDSRQFTVRFLHSDACIDAAAVRKGSFFGSTDYYKINAIKLVEVS